MLYLNIISEKFGNNMGIEDFNWSQNDISREFRQHYRRKVDNSIVDILNGR